MRAVLDARLVGYWSDQDLYQGAMEAADIAFCPDRTGWTYWSRVGGAFFVLRFSWRTAPGHELTLDLYEKLSGTWDLDGHATRHHVESQTAYGQQLVLAYEIRAGQDAARRPATLLELDQPVSMGTIGDRFAFKRELAEAEHDPTTRSPRDPSGST